MAGNYPADEIEVRYIYVDRSVPVRDEETERENAMLRREIAGLKQEVFRLRQQQNKRR